MVCGFHIILPLIFSMVYKRYSFQGLRIQGKVCWSQVQRVGWVWHNRCLVFCQISANKEQRMSWHIMVMQHPNLVLPQFYSYIYSIPQTPWNYVELLVYCQTMWNKFVLDKAFPVKKSNHHHCHVWLTHADFFDQCNPFPIHYNNFTLVLTSSP